MSLMNANIVRASPSMTAARIFAPAPPRREPAIIVSAGSELHQDFAANLAILEPVQAFLETIDGKCAVDNRS